MRPRSMEMDLGVIAVADGEDARLAAAQQRAHQLGDARGLDVPAYRQLVVGRQGLGIERDHRGSSRMNARKNSMGIGKMMVEFFSAAISVRVCR